jgi:ribonuclease P protein component
VAANFCFPREEHLKKQPDIRAAFKAGRSAGCYGAKLFFRKNGLGHNRVAFTFVKKFGNAVSRNHSRRLSREAYRHIRCRLSCGYDMVVLVYHGDVDYEGRVKQLAALFGRAGLLCG